MQLLAGTGLRGLPPKYRQSHSMNTNVVLGEDITLNRYFLILAGVNRSAIRQLRKYGRRC